MSSRVKLHRTSEGYGEAALFVRLGSLMRGVRLLEEDLQLMEELL